MARVEIDEAEFLRLQKLNNFSHAMLQHPDAAKLVERAAKLVDPNIKTPRLDQEAAVQNPLQEMQAKFDKLSKQIEDRDSAQAQNQTLAQLSRVREEGIRQLRQQGYTDDGVKAVEELMEKKGLLDPLDAAAIHEKLNPLPSPSMPGATGAWNFMESVTDDSDADLKRLIETRGEVDIVTDQIARKALAEVRSQGRR